MLTKTQLEKKQRKYPQRFKYKLYFKSGGASICLFDKQTYFSALHKKKILTQMYDGWKGTFIVTV